MRKITALLLFWVCVMSMNAQVVIGTKTYSVDTIFQRQIGPGVVHTRLRIPDYPLNVYLLEVDMTNPYNRVETTQAYNTLGKTEKLENAYNRHKAAGKKPLAACNASFWCVSSQKPWYDFMPGVPHGAEVVNDTIYTNTSRNGLYDFNGGSVNTASTIITKDKRALVGRHEWYACAKSAKFSGDQEIVQVNKLCDHNQLVLFNHARGRNHTFFTYPDTCDYVFLKLKEGESWKIAKDIKFEVAEVKTKATGQVLGNYDACLVADGPYKDEMRKLTVGDEVTINTYWFNIDGDKTPIEVENMTEGEAHVMLNGEITNRANGDYGAMVYSRTAYGSNADGTKLYMIVIDKSTHPEYGKSAGCTATVMCQIWKSLVPDLWNAANMDAGGSAQMLVDGAIVNQTNEGSPRAVANGMMMFSTAPDEEKDMIAVLRFVEPHHKCPAYSEYAPKVLGYNKYGELISEEVAVTYTCSESIGSANSDGTAIDLGGNTALGTITAHYNDVEVTAPIYVQTAETSIRIKPIVIDDVREYAMEVQTASESGKDICDPLRFTWTVEDESVAKIENGVLRGLKEGITKVTAELGDFKDETMVRVEISPQWQVFQQWDGWTLNSENLSKDAVLSTEGLISFGYEGKSDASITMTKDIEFYSLPDHLWLEFTSTTPLLKVEMDIRSSITANDEEEHLVRYPASGSLKAGERFKVDILPLLGDINDLGIYPVILKKIKIIPFIKKYVAGDNIVTIHGLWAEYKNNSSRIEVAKNTKGVISVFPTIVTDGVLSVNAIGMDIVKVSIYNMAGTLLYNGDVNVCGGGATISPDLSGGMYYVKVSGEGKTIVEKVIIK